LVGTDRDYLNSRCLVLGAWCQVRCWVPGAKCRAGLRFRGQPAQCPITVVRDIIPARGIPPRGVARRL